MMLFPMSAYWWVYLGFVTFVILMLALDLGVFHRQAHEVSFKEATAWSVLWVSLALLFNLLFYVMALERFKFHPMYQGIEDFDPATQARTSALEFLAGFVVEKSLAIDNIFIFAIVFSYFAIPKIYQHRILFWGILGALVFRAIFVALGAVLMQYHWVVVGFGVLLIFTGIKMLTAGTESQDLDKNVLLKWLRKIFRVEPKLHGAHFFVRKDGILYVTPLFVALIFLELTDIIFAIDSVPAIFALTKEPLIVFTSNIFAILGLRSMYFMLSGFMDRFRYIKYGLAAVLMFVGVKMAYLTQAFDGKFPISWSLGIIAFLIGSSVLFSVYMNRREQLT